MLTEKTLEALSVASGSAHDAENKNNIVAIPKENILYVGDRTHWVLAFLNPEEQFGADKFRFLKALAQEHGHRSERLDGRVLVSSHIDPAARTFLPPKGIEHEPIVNWVPLIKRPSSSLRYPDWESIFDRIDITEKYADLIEETYSSIDKVSLRELHEKGEGRYYYAPRSTEGAWANRTSKSLWFRLGKRVLALNAGWAEAFFEMGLDIRVDPEGSSYAGPPACLLVSPCTTVVGIIMPTTLSGVRESRKGLSIHADAADISWVTVDVALNMLSNSELHPLAKLPDRMTDIPGWGQDSSTISRAVSVLRWQGWEDASIEDAYFRARQASLEMQYLAVIKEAEDLYEKDQLMRRDSWWTKDLEYRLKPLCKRLEILQALAGKPLEMGRIPELVASL